MKSNRSSSSDQRNKTSLSPPLLAVERNKTHWHIRLNGNLPLASMAELRSTLLAWQASGTNLALDLGRSEISVALMQLLWTVEHEAQQRGNAQVQVTASDEVKRVGRNAGFEHLFKAVPPSGSKASKITRQSRARMPERASRTESSDSLTTRETEDGRT